MLSNKFIASNVLIVYNMFCKLSLQNVETPRCKSLYFKVRNFGCYAGGVYSIIIT